MGFRGLSQLSCRVSGLNAVKTSGPGALGVLRVNEDPENTIMSGQNVFSMDVFAFGKTTTMPESPFHLAQG